MKLEFDPNKVKRSADFEEEMFGIGDVTVILNILRSKLYSNPIKAFTQEIMSNARDAHRELGKGNTPIEVKLPTHLDPQFHVRDFGPGISPDRMVNVFIRYGNCLPGETMIWGPDGYKPIKDVKIGDKVYSFDPKTSKLVVGKVKRTFNNGVKQCYKVKTQHRELIATGNHPVLSFNKNRSKQVDYVPVEDLVCCRYEDGLINRTYSDQIFYCSDANGETISKFSQLLPKSIKDYEKTNNNSPRTTIKLPEEIPSWFCRFFGFMLGDGWRGNDYKSQKYSVSFALSVYSDLNNYYKGCINKMGLDCLTTKDQTQVKVNSVILSQVLEDLGWIDGFDKKRIPSWIFSLSRENKKAFLDGFIDADGWSTKQDGRKPLRHFEISNKNMAYDFKNLIDSLGYKSGNVRVRKARKISQIISKGPAKGKVVRSKNNGYMLSFSDQMMKKQFDHEHIIGVEKEKKHQVYDIEIDNELHNFIANGVVVHNSTKRNDNDQTGGFGIGAKSPWSYSESFIIVSNTPDKDGKMVSRQYIAYIDEGRTGKLAKVEENETTEPQGTTIIVPCKPNDESQFADWVKNCSQFWDVRPTIKGVPNWTWPEHKVLFQGTNWNVTKRDYSSYGRQIARAIIDGIPYPLNWDSLQINKMKEDDQDTLNHLFNFPLCMTFKTGELPLTANREEIDYSPKAIKILQDKLLAVVKELTVQVSDGIKNAKNLWEANSLWLKVKNDFSGIVNSVTWNGKKITGDAPALNGTHIFCTRYNRIYSGNDFRKVSGSSYGGYKFDIGDEYILLVNDEKTVQPNRRRLKTIFNDPANKDVRRVCVLSLPDDPKDLATAEKHWKDLEIDLYCPQKITDFVKAPIVRTVGGTGRSGYTVPRIWKFVPDTGNLKDIWTPADAELIEEGDDKYVLLKNRNATLVNGKTVSMYDLQSMNKAFNGKEAIYGISEKYKDKIGQDWEPIEKALQKKLDELLKDPGVISLGSHSYDYHYFPNYAFNHAANAIYQDDDWKQRITDKTCCLYKYLTASDEIKEAQQKIESIESLAEILKASGVPAHKTTAWKYDLPKMVKAVSAAYPLLSMVYRDWNASQKQQKDAIFEYINLINDRNNVKKATAVSAISVAVPKNAVIVSSCAATAV